jgi:carbon-monoxide dehydrogenase medium subunit
MATLVGNIISAQPAADGAIPLMALEAEIKVASVAGERWIPLNDAYRGRGRSAVDPAREITMAVRFKKPGAQGLTAFFRLARRKALALPTINGAVALLRDASGCRLPKARIALGPVAEKPFRPQKAEAFLESHDISRGTIMEAARIASEEASPRTSPLRGGDDYRKEMIRLYLSRTLCEILAMPQ